MTPCDRFEREGLLQWERGEPLEEHFESCPDCRAARAAYEQLQQQIANVAVDEEAPVGWQRQVWDTLEARSSARRSPTRRAPRWIWPMLPAAGLAVAILGVLLVRLPPSASDIALQVELTAGSNAARRGDDAHPGDELTLRARVGDARHAELRVYRDDVELLLRCSTEPPCQRHAEVLEATFELPSIGSYHTLLLVAEHSLPEPSTSFDEDVGMALDTGARIEPGREIHVR